MELGHKSCATLALWLTLGLVVVAAGTASPTAAGAVPPVAAHSHGRRLATVVDLVPVNAAPLVVAGVPTTVAVSIGTQFGLTDVTGAFLALTQHRNCSDAAALKVTIDASGTTTLPQIVTKRHVCYATPASLGNDDSDFVHQGWFVQPIPSTVTAATLVAAAPTVLSAGASATLQLAGASAGGYTALVPTSSAGCTGRLA